jgi:hypothetical protein
MGYGKKQETAEWVRMSPEAFARLMEDVLAYDPQVLAELRKRHAYEKAIKLMRDVAELVQLGYPKLEAIVTAEENLVIFHGI